MSVVLADYPDLVEDFVAFLDPDQAIEAGVVRCKVCCVGVSLPGFRGSHVVHYVTKDISLSLL